MDEPRTLAGMLEDAARRFGRRDALVFDRRSMTYRELNEGANKTANAFVGLGLRRGDRVAIMLPNIPEFVTTFFGIQKMGGIAVPLNTLYKGREIVHVLKDSGARAIVTLTHFSQMIHEIRSETPELEFVIVTGQRTLVFVEPGATSAVQISVGRSFFDSDEDAYRKIGEAAAEALRSLGVQEARYKHWGGIRVRGRKIAATQIRAHENIYLVNIIIFLDKLDTDAFFRAIWVPPEIKDKVLEPLASASREAGTPVRLSALRDAMVRVCGEQWGITFERGAMQRDERFGYEKARALAYRT